jgi:prepilin-type N-terminal cleavage/methylation domain-containing protein
MQQAVAQKRNTPNRMSGHSVKAPRSMRGYTLVELVVVLAIIAMIILYGASGLFQSKEDAKVQSAKTQLLKDFPSGIQRLVTMANACNNTSITKAKLESRGVPATTVFGGAWTVTTSGGNTATVTYPLDIADADLATALKDSLTGAPNVKSVTGSATQVVVNYACN